MVISVLFEIETMRGNDPNIIFCVHGICLRMYNSVLWLCAISQSDSPENIAYIC